MEFILSATDHGRRSAGAAVRPGYPAHRSGIEDGIVAVALLGLLALCACLFVQAVTAMLAPLNDAGIVVVAHRDALGKKQAACDAPTHRVTLAGVPASILVR